MSDKTVLIDADVVCFSCSAAAEKKFVRYKGQRFKNISELRLTYPGVAKEDVERIVEPEPFSHARQNARGLWQRILDACAPVRDYRGYISGEDNFRYEIATLKPYKGNRDRSEEPTWRKDLEAYLLADFPVERTQGHEADDRLAVECLKDVRNTILATIDKDMAQLPGANLYRWDTNEHVTVSGIEAARNFYKQMLTGDATDSIPGCIGIGKAKAEKALANVKEEKLMATIVYTHYQKSYGKTAWDAYVENARLLYLCRTEEELADPKNAWKPIITPGI